MHSAFNLLFLPNSMFTSLLFFYYERAMCSPKKQHLKIHIIIIIIIDKLMHQQPKKKSYIFMQNEGLFLLWHIYTYVYNERFCIGVNINILK